jgi:hypothetical protein
MDQSRPDFEVGSVSGPRSTTWPDKTRPAVQGHRRDEPANARRRIKALVEEHILPRLDADFVEHFASTQALGARPELPVTNPPIEHVRAHPEAYRSPCALDTSGYPRVTTLSCPSQDGVNIDVRVYHPDPAKHGPGPYPLHLNFHGEFLMHPAERTTS